MRDKCPPNHSGAKASHRVKYGVLNPTACEKGVMAASHYGSSYLLLKDHVRTRVTFTSRDSGGVRCKLGTCEHFAHVLAEFSDPDLQAVLSRVGSGSGSTAAPPQGQYRETQYKEMQVHGDIVLARDVQAIVLVGMQDNAANERLAVKFGRKFGVAVVLPSYFNPIS